MRKWIISLAIVFTVSGSVPPALKQVCIPIIGVPYAKVCCRVVKGKLECRGRSF